MIASSSSLNDTYDGTAGVITTLIFHRNTIVSAGCTTEVTISPGQGPYDIGDELTCSADGYVRSYTWTLTANANIVVSSTDEVTLSEGPFRYTCTAEIEETGCTGSGGVSGIGKMSKKQHTTLVTICGIDDKKIDLY